MRGMRTVSMYKYLHLSSKKEVKIGRNRPASSSFFFSRRFRSSSLQAPPRETSRDNTHPRCSTSSLFFLFSFFFLFQMLDEIPFFSRIPERRNVLFCPPFPHRTFKKSLYSRGRAQKHDRGQHVRVRRNVAASRNEPSFLDPTPRR